MRYELRGDEDAATCRDGYLADKVDTSAVEIAQTAPNSATAIIYIASDRARALHQSPSACLGDVLLAEIHRAISKLEGFQGTCERLKATPVPLPYQLLVNRTVWLYVLLSPCAFVQLAGWWTPIICACTAYVFFGLEETAHQLERPFSSKSVHNVPIAAMCRQIDISIAQALGEPAPQPLMADSRLYLP
jgi:putative membrane protein